MTPGLMIRLEFPPGVTVIGERRNYHDLEVDKVRIFHRDSLSLSVPNETALGAVLFHGERIKSKKGRGCEVVRWLQYSSVLHDRLTTVA